MLTTHERALLEKLHQEFLALEKSLAPQEKDFLACQGALAHLQESLTQLHTHPNPQIARLAGIAGHLTPQMTLKHFIGFMLPLERLLNKKLEDGDFLVTTQDREEKVLSPLPLVFVLDNMRSAFNVGSIFRTAECLNIQGLYLCGYTPLPEQDKVAKSAMGTESHVPWHEEKRALDCVQKLKSQGYRLVALETSPQATEIYEDFTLTPTAFLFGNERFGLGDEVLALVDEVRIIPLRGMKNSLNVGVTAAIAGFEWMRQWNTQSKP